LAESSEFRGARKDYFVDLSIYLGKCCKRLTTVGNAVRDKISHFAALMRLKSSGDSLARVVNARGDTVGIGALERLARASVLNLLEPGADRSTPRFVFGYDKC